MLEEPAIPYSKLAKVRVEDVRQYIPNNKLKISVRYCEHCEENLGVPYISECDAEICEDPIKCPYSADWDGCACGYIVCSHCHRAAKSRLLVIDEPELVESVVDEIGIDGEVNWK